MIENTTVLLQGFAIVFNQWCDLTGSCGLAPALVSLFPPPWSVISWWGRQSPAVVLRCALPILDEDFIGDRPHGTWGQGCKAEISELK